MTDARKTLAQLKKLLFTRDPETTAQGVELLRSLGDPALFDALLTGVTWACPERRDPMRPVWGSFTIGGSCANAPATGRFDLMVALALLGAAPPESAVASTLLASVTSLTLDRGYEYNHARPIDLAPLRAFVKLERLWVRTTGPITALDALAGLPALRELHLDGAFDDLTGLSGSRSLERLTVHSAGFVRSPPLTDVPALREVDLAACYNLQSLDLVRALDGLTRLRLNLHHYQAGDLAPLAGLTALRALAIDHGNVAITSLAPLASLAALEELSLHNCGGVTTLAPLRALPALRSVDVASCAQIKRLGLDGAPALRRVHVRWSGLRDVDDLAGHALDDVDVSTNSALESVAGLRATTTLRDLSTNSNALRSLEGVEGSAGLEVVALHGARSIATLRHLAGAQSLKTLWLPSCASLASLDGVEGCASLATCILEGGAFEDVTALAKLEKLEKLSLRDCAQVRDVSALAALPALRALILAGTGVEKASLPAKLRAITSFAKDADLNKLAAKPPPAPREPVIPPAIAKEHRAVWTRLKKLLLSRDPETIDQGVELVRALEDPTLYAELLDGVTWGSPDRKHPYGTVLMKGSWFEDTAPAEPYRLRAVLALAAAAPAGCAPADALKDSLTMLSFNGNVSGKVAAPFDAAPLAAFTRLEMLHVTRAAAITNTEALASLRSLKKLDLRVSGAWGAFDMAGLTALTEVNLFDCPLDQVARLRDAPALRTAAVGTVRGDGDLVLDGLGALESFSLTSAPGVRSVSLRDCPKLSTATCAWLGGVERVDVTGCAVLRTLTVASNNNLKELRGLDTLSALVRLDAASTPAAWIPSKPVTGLTHLRYAQWPLTDCAPLRAFPQLRSLDLSGSPQLVSVRELAELTQLTALYLQWCGKLASLEGLEALPLQTLSPQGIAVKGVDAPESLRRFFK
jgi:Leucine-rich repeat (LRR) protein